MANRISRLCKTGKDYKAFLATKGIDAVKLETMLTYTGLELDVNDPPVKRFQAALKAAYGALADSVGKADKKAADAIRTVGLASALRMGLINGGCQNPAHFATCKLPMMPGDVSVASDSGEEVKLD